MDSPDAIQVKELGDYCFVGQMIYPDFFDTTLVHMPSGC
jgi:hypothetical protein